MNSKNPPVLFFGDSCVGTDPSHMRNLKRVVDLSLELVDRHRVTTGFFLGDQVMGYCDSQTLRRQWKEFTVGPIRDLSDRLLNFRQIASNHVSYDAESVAVYEEVCGPAEWGVIFDGVQYLALNTAWPSRGGNGGVDCDVLERRLSALDPSLPIVVIGHHPIWPVNGFGNDLSPWNIPADEGKRAWDIMRAKGVTLYACSHIIAFDVQLHDGLVQLCTGGAGTEYGPAGAMPGLVEGLHAVLVDGLGTGRLEIDRIPAADTHAEKWLLVRTATGWTPVIGPTVGNPTEAQGIVMTIRSSGGELGNFKGFAKYEGPPVLDIEVGESQLRVELVPCPGEDPRMWRGRIPQSWSEIRLVAQTWTGPGGLLISVDGSEFNSLEALCSRGLEQVRDMTVMSSFSDVAIQYLI